MIALIDGDIVLHRIGFITENEDLRIAIWRCNELIDRILKDTNASEYRFYLSDSKENNFRYQIDPNYKANRTQPKPKWYEDLKEHVILHHGAMFAHGMEADDALGIAQGKETIVCSIDKDLMQIPGRHYNFVKNIFTTVSEEEALLSFYRSILIGDIVDNIEGVYGIGPAKAAKLIASPSNEEQVIDVLYSEYCRPRKQRNGEIYGEEPLKAIERIRKNGRLLKIKQSVNEELWDSHILKQKEEHLRSSIPKQGEEPSQSTALTGQEEMSGDGSQLAGTCSEITKQDTKQSLTLSVP